MSSVFVAAGIQPLVLATTLYHSLVDQAPNLGVIFDPCLTHIKPDLLTKTATLTFNTAIIQPQLTVFII